MLPAGFQPTPVGPRNLTLGPKQLGLTIQMCLSQARILRGGGVPDPLNFRNIHLTEKHFQRYQGVFLHAQCTNSRLASLACYHI